MRRWRPTSLVSPPISKSRLANFPRPLAPTPSRNRPKGGNSFMRWKWTLPDWREHRLVRAGPLPGWKAKGVA
jgi:hypothetical protein